jgi:sec-independent protein translocase protein TatA
MVPGVPSMGGAELLILLAIILLFFGAKRIPELGRSLGRGMKEFRKGTSEDLDEAELGEHKENAELPSREEAHATEPKEASLREEESSSRAAEPPTTRSANGRGSY